MKKSLVFTALLAATPLALLLPGCSGGGLGGNLFPTPTPKPAVTATPVPGVSQTSNFTLGNGQRAILQTVRNSTQITGSIQILAPLANTRASAALTRSLKIGTFTIGGNFIPQRGYSISVFDAGVQIFTLSGLFPTATETGTYTLTANGETDSGILPIAGGPTTTATPTVTTTPTSTPGNGTINLTFTASSDANYVKVPLTVAKFTQASGLVGVALSGDDGTNFTTLSMGNVSATQGASVSYTPSTFFNFYIYDQPRSSVLKPFFVKGGTVTLTALSATSATFTFKDVLYVANEGSAARGSITVNGTVSGPLTKF